MKRCQGREGRRHRRHAAAAGPNSERPESSLASTQARIAPSGAADPEGHDEPRPVGVAEIGNALGPALQETEQTKAQLREKEAHFAAVLNSVTDAIILVDSTHRIRLFNRAAERVFRLPAPDAIGQPAERFLSNHFRSALRSLSPGHSTVGQCVGRPVAGVRANGEEFPMEASVVPAQGNGEALYAVVLRDMTERQRSEGALRRLARVVEEVAESVFITDREGRIEYVNPAFERQTGYTRAEAVNRTPAIVKSGKHDQAFYENLWRTILSGEPFRAVFTNQRKTGELYYDLQTITPLRDEHGVISHFVAASRDITERKRAEQALLNLNKQLEREAERIAHALHDEAGQFLTAAHIALAELVRDLPSSARQRVAEAREHLNQVEEQLRGLSRELRPRILEDLGLPAALEFLAQGVMRRTGIAVAMEVALDERLPRIVETTLYRLAQEALTNASRHAQATRIDVRLAREGRTVRCVVRDNGIGFDVPDVLDRRGDSRLGLVGVRDRLEALGGTLRIDSIPGQGTELHVFVPLEP